MRQLCTVAWVVATQQRQQRLLSQFQGPYTQTHKRILTVGVRAGGKAPFLSSNPRNNNI